MFKKLAIKKQTENSSKRIIKINRQETQATVDYEINGEQHKITVVHFEAIRLRHESKGKDNYFELQIDRRGSFNEMTSSEKNRAWTRRGPLTSVLSTFRFSDGQNKISGGRNKHFGWAAPIWSTY
jgi:hypothetical protein